MITVKESTAQMIIIYKNRGFLIPIYFMLSVIFTATLGKYLLSLIFGPLTYGQDGVWIGLGVSCLITAIVIFLTKNDYIEDKNGLKKKIDMENSFFFIRMEYWVVIFFCLGIVSLIASLF